MNDWNDPHPGAGGEAATTEPRVPPRFVPTLTEVLPAVPPAPVAPVWPRADAEIAPPVVEPTPEPVWLAPPLAPPALQLGDAVTHEPPDAAALVDHLVERVMDRLEARLPALMADWVAGLQAEVLAATHEVLREETQAAQPTAVPGSSSSA